jgi:hypothetical protein
MDFGSNISSRSSNSINRIIVRMHATCKSLFSHLESRPSSGRCDDHAVKTGIILTFLDVP